MTAKPTAKARLCPSAEFNLYELCLIVLTVTFKFEAPQQATLFYLVCEKLSSQFAPCLNLIYDFIGKFV